MSKESWAQEQLRRSALSVQTASKGVRNETVFSEALRIGSYIRDETLSVGTARVELVQAGEKIGLPRAEIQGAIDRGFEAALAERAWYPGITEEKRRVQAEKRRVLPPSDEGRILFTLYPSITKPAGELSRESPVLQMREPFEGDKESAPLWGWHQMLDNSRAKGKKCLGVTALVLDYDDDPDFSYDRVEAWWGDVVYYAHTSWSHNIAKESTGVVCPRGRVIVPYSRMVTEEEHSIITRWALLCGRGRPGELELKSPKRAYFVPTKGVADYWFRTSSSCSTLDVDAILELEEELAVDLDAMEPDLEVMKLLEFSKNDGIKKTRMNLTEIIRHDERIGKRFWYNEFSDRLMYGERDFEDHHAAAAWEWIARVYGVEWAVSSVWDVLNSEARSSLGSRNPLQEYLLGLEWDGEDRIGNWLHSYCGADDNKLNRAMGARWLLSAAWRALRPGCQADHCLVLYSPRQGIGKSTGLQALAGREFFSESALDIDSKEGPHAIQGCWIAEIPEWESMRRSTAESMKRFLSVKVDRYRAPYAKTPISRPRTCVFAGTTNKAEVVQDSTGARRLWVVEVRDIDVPRIRADRDQIWAQCVAIISKACKAGGLYSLEHLISMDAMAFDDWVPKCPKAARWWLQDEESRLQEEAVEEYQQEDPLITKLEELLSGTLHTQWTGSQIMEKLELDPARNRGVWKSLGPALRKLGWKNVRKTDGGLRFRVWVRA